MTKPITPEEAVKAKQKTIPPQVFEAFNDCISKHFNGRSARFTQKEVVEVIRSKLPHISTTQVYANHWLDVEDQYRAVGWQVTYDRPGYNESYEANFTFTKRGR